MTLPRVASLEAIAQAIADPNNRTRLTDMIRRMKVAQSCVADLTLASHTIEALVELMRTGWQLSPVHSVAAEHAMIANAVLLYARATSTHGSVGERGSISIEDRLSSEDRADHRRLLALRNRALAHVYSEELFGENVWHQESAIALDNGYSWVPLVASVRVQVEPETIATLAGLLPKAIALVRDTYQKSNERVVNEMHRIGVTQQEFEAQLIDPISLFGSEEEATLALSRESQMRGQSAGVIRH